MGIFEIAIATVAAIASALGLAWLLVPIVLKMGRKPDESIMAEEGTKAHESIKDTVDSFAASQPMSGSKAAKMFVAEFFGHAAIINALRASMNDKYTKQQTEVVARIVWRNSQVPLTAILKVPEERYNIYRGLSDPNQYPWDTNESKYI